MQQRRDVGNELLLRKMTPRYAFAAVVKSTDNDAVIVIGGLKMSRSPVVRQFAEPQVEQVGGAAAAVAGAGDGAGADGSASAGACRGAEFEPRFACSASLVGSRHVYVFGGAATDVRAGGRVKVLGDLCVLDCVQWHWRIVNTRSAACPAPRFAHVTVFDAKRRRLLLHGGTDSAGVRLGDVWAFDVEQSRWLRLAARGAVAHMRRSEHSAVLATGDSMVCFGGRAADTLYRDGLCNDAFVYDVSSDACSMLAVRGKPPSPRRGHAACFVSVKAELALGDDDVDSLSYDVRQMFVSGGFGADCRFADLWRLVWHGAGPPFWQRVDVKWDLPRFRPRGMHALVALRDRLLLLGGFDDEALGDAVSLPLKLAANSTPPKHVVAESAVGPDAERACVRCHCALSRNPLKWRENLSRASACQECQRCFCHKCAHTLVYLNAAGKTVCAECALRNPLTERPDDEDASELEMGADSGDERDALSDSQSGDDDADSDGSGRGARRPDDPSTWSVSDVGVWLQSIGLGRYLVAFADSAVDGDLLRDVSDHLLQSTIKMTSAAHRRSFRAAVRVLFSEQRRSGGVVAWSLADVLAWLHAIRLDSLTAAFRENAVHGALLVQLDSTLCDELGISNIVHRLKLRTRLQQALVEQSAVGGARDELSVTDVGHWLTEMGLSRFVPAFAECSVDGALLMHLDDEHVAFALSLTSEVPPNVAALQLRSFALARAQLRRARTRAYQLALEQARQSSDDNAEASSGSRSLSVVGERAVQSDPLQWSIARVGRWLAKVRLAVLKPQFFACAVHGALLLHLTDEELELGLGVANELHRLKILKRAAMLRKQAEAFQALVDSFDAHKAAVGASGTDDDSDGGGDDGDGDSERDADDRGGGAVDFFGASSHSLVPQPRRRLTKQVLVYDDEDEQAEEHRISHSAKNTRKLQR